MKKIIAFIYLFASVIASAENDAAEDTAANQLLLLLPTVVYITLYKTFFYEPKTENELNFYSPINYLQMKIPTLFAAGLLLYTSGFSQNAGIGATIASEKLPVAGTAKKNTWTIATGGNASEFPIKSNPDGQVSFKTVHTGLGVNYIIALEGAFPAQSSPQVLGTMIGEIKIFTGGYAPYGWAFCHG